MLNDKQLEIIKVMFADLKGKKLNCIGRAASMAWIGFGDDIFCTDRYGKTIKKSEYALHIQCSFRIRNDGGCILAFQDIFEPRADIEYNDNFVCDSKDYSLYDELSNKFNKYVNSRLIRVNKIEINLTGDLCIFLDNGIIIEVFVDSSHEECYRFFKVNTDKEHLVLYGDKMELQ